jgi:hypothetical protein
VQEHLRAKELQPERPLPDELGKVAFETVRTIRFKEVIGREDAPRSF